MTTPRVSVLLPVRDGAATIDEALESMQRQTLREIEILVIDDGSKDDTAQKVSRRARRDSRIVLLRRPATGIVGALNEGARLARASLLARMDADDISISTRLARQVSWLDRRLDLDVVGSQVESFGELPITEGWRSYERWLNGCLSTTQIARDLLVESPLAHPSVMMRRSALMAVGGYRDFDGPEDYDLWLRLARAGCRFAKVPAVLLRWRDGSERLTRTDGRYRPEAFMGLKADHLVAGPLSPSARAGRALLLWGAGRDGGRFGRTLMARGVAIEAFIDIDPRRVGSTRHHRPVISPKAIGGYERPLVVAAVGVKGARRLIRGRLSRRKLVEGRDYFVCA